MPVTLSRYNAIEGNKLICESEFVSEDVLYQLDLLKKVGKPVADDFFFLYVDYHRNMDSLKAVITNIERTGLYEVDIASKECLIIDKKSGAPLSHAKMNSELEAAWFAVVHFLHWLYEK